MVYCRTRGQFCMNKIRSEGRGNVYPLAGDHTGCPYVDSPEMTGGPGMSGMYADAPTGIKGGESPFLHMIALKSTKIVDA
jgi:hypothetical protein